MSERAPKYPRFRKGDRVCMSDAGRVVLDPRGKRLIVHGTVKGISRNTRCNIVLWDDRKAVQSISHSFLELAPVYRVALTELAACDAGAAGT